MKKKTHWHQSVCMYACTHVHAACQSHSRRIREGKLHFSIPLLLSYPHTHIQWRFESSSQQVRLYFITRHISVLSGECVIALSLKAFVNDVHSILIYFIRFFYAHGDWDIFFLLYSMFAFSVSKKKKKKYISFSISIRLFSPFLSITSIK